MVVGELTNGARACLQATKAATGAPHVFDIEVFGSRGGMQWRHETPQALVVMRPDGTSTTCRRSSGGLDPAAAASMRLPCPQPEGFREAFANIYGDFGHAVVDRLVPADGPPPEREWPDARYALRGAAFVDACTRSSDTRMWVRLSVDAEQGG